jgi:hypothetical protein
MEYNGTLGGFLWITPSKEYLSTIKRVPFNHQKSTFQPSKEYLSAKLKSLQPFKYVTCRGSQNLLKNSF